VSPAALSALNILQVLGFGVLTAKLLSSGLARTYRYLTIRAAFECLRVGIAYSMPKNTETYAHFYFATQPILWILDVLMLLEVYTAVFNGQKGIATFSRRVILGAMVVSATLAMASFAFRPAAAPLSETLAVVAALERAVNISLLCFIAVLIGFLTWFPVRLSRNTLVHSTVFSVYFALRAITSLIRTSISLDLWLALNIVAVSASVLSILVWIIRLTPHGEQVTVRAGMRRDAVEQERLMEQLESINRSLLRTARD
jgi:hypothetical protein